MRVAPTPSRSTITFEFTFGADGGQLRAGASGWIVRASRADVTSCVLATLPPIRIPAPGAVARADVSFTLP